IIAGGALFVRGGQPQHGAKTYRWIDPAGTTDVSYLLEDVDLNGTRTMHGPVRLDSNAIAFSAHTASASVASRPLANVSNSMLLTQLNGVAAQFMPIPRPVNPPRPILPKPAPGTPRVSLEDVAAVKISVTQEGWYRVTQPQLVAAGLDPNADIRTLQFFAEG